MQSPPMAGQKREGADLHRKGPPPAFSKGKSMARLHVANVKLSEEFNAALLQLGVVMPLDHHPGEIGEVVDATGRNVLQVDPCGSLPDEQANAIASLIILAINTCGSFRTAQTEEPADA